MPASRRPPGPSYWTPCGPARLMRRDPLGFIAAIARDYGDVVRIGLGPVPLYLIHHPDGVRPRLTQQTRR